MGDFYGADLAHVHDAGFSGLAIGSAPGILQILKSMERPGALVVDLGCGPGTWAKMLVDGGYRVVGIDISEGMLDIGEKRVPEGEFRCESIYEAELPKCHAVTAIGECLNYIGGPSQTNDWTGLFARAFQALEPGGVFIFDVAGPGQLSEAAVQKSFTEGDGWLVLVQKSEEGDLLTRDIITFLRHGETYRRTDETHYQRLLAAEEVTEMLLRAGFEVSAGTVYGEFTLPPAHTAFIARKPA